jgi:hypothetical protein
MSWANLNENEKEIVLQCLVAATEGLFFPDWEFQILMGYSRDDFKGFINEWDKLDKSSNQIETLIISVLGNLTSYPHREEEALKNYTCVDEKTLQEIGNKIML